MHIHKQQCTPVLAQLLGLDLRHVGSAAFYNTRARTALVTKVIDMGRDGTTTERTLVSRGEEFVITECEIRPWGRQPHWKFSVGSLRALKSSESTRLRRFAQAALACELPPQRVKRFVVEVVDRTRSPSPVPFATLRRKLKDYCAMLTKEMSLSSSIDLVIPALIPSEDAQKFQSHIRESGGGRGLSILELVVFQLAYERHRSFLEAKHQTTLTQLPPRK
jgi:hypothetical protein